MPVQLSLQRSQVQAGASACVPLLPLQLHWLFGADMMRMWLRKMRKLVCPCMQGHWHTSPKFLICRLHTARFIGLTSGTHYLLMTGYFHAWSWRAYRRKTQRGDSLLASFSTINTRAQSPYCVDCTILNLTGVLIYVNINLHTRDSSKHASGLKCSIK